MQRVVSFLLVCLCMLLLQTGWTQSCATLGQSPSTAFPVCGTNTFTQSSVPICGGKKIPTPCNDGNPYTDVNPYWYKFTCYVSGTLGFVITPNNLGDDYDWELFDITGRLADDVYSDPSLIVSANWSGSYGITGTSSTAKNPYECASMPSQSVSTYSTLPNIIAGHDYLLLISHYDGATQSGYTLAFPTGQQGGTASIVNPVVPTVIKTYAVCDGSEIVVILNKKINCNSIAADGSDFSVSGGPVPIGISNATGNGCGAEFDSDTLLLKLDKILSPATYTVSAKIGTDGNSLTDNCANQLPPGAIGTIQFIPAQPTPMDSIHPVICISDTLTLEFSKPIQCSSIAADGSDFVISGPASVTVAKALGKCNNGVSSYVTLVLAAPIRVNGTFTIRLQNGTDGNSLIDECGEITPAGSTLSFTTQHITTADFQTAVHLGCVSDTVLLSHNAYGGTTQWQWNLDSSFFSNQQNPILISKNFGKHNLLLAVGNGFCTDTAFTQFDLIDQTVKSQFTVQDTLCPTDTLHFTDLSSANTVSWKWNFGNGFISALQHPAAQSYPLLGRQMNYTASLSVLNNLGCEDISFKRFTVLASCYIAVPSGFTPNGDGLNDYLYPLNAFNADQLVFQVYNRYGQRIFETRDWTRKWDGRVNGQLQPSGTYVWTLSYIERNTGKAVNLKGTTVLIR